MTKLYPAAKTHKTHPTVTVLYSQRVLCLLGLPGEEIDILHKDWERCCQLWLIVWFLSLVKQDKTYL